MSTTKSEHILVIKLGALGDFIQALGPMAAIRKHHPKATIILLTTKSFVAFGRQSGYFDNVLIDERPGLLNIKGWLALRTVFNRVKFDRVYDLQNNDRTSFYFKLFNPKPEWVGTAKGASHRNDSPERTAGHAFDGHVQTLGLAGIQDIKIDRLDWMQEDIGAFALKSPYVLLVPGASPSRPEKRWPAANYARLAKMIVQLGYQPVVLGGESEKETVRIIEKDCSEVLNLVNQTSLKHIAVLARGAAGAIGNDTGPMHLIGVTDCPSLVLFSGRSDPVRHAPMGDKISILQEEDLKNLSAETVLKNFKP